MGEGNGELRTKRSKWGSERFAVGRRVVAVGLETELREAVLATKRGRVQQRAECTMEGGGWEGSES